MHASISAASTHFIDVPSYEGLCLDVFVPLVVLGSQNTVFGALQFYKQLHERTST